MSNDASFWSTGYHPHDGGINWLGGIPGLDSVAVFRFMNGFAAAIQPLVHQVSRLEIGGRDPNGRFYWAVLEKGMLNSGPVVVIQARQNSPLNTGVEFYREVPKTGSETTEEWLARAYEYLRMFTEGLHITIPSSPASWMTDAPEVAPGEPAYVSEMGQPSSSPLY